MKLKITTMLMLLASSLMAQQKISKEFSGVKEINLSTSSGDCILKKGTSDKILVEVEYTYDKDDYDPEFEQSGESLRIKEVFNSRSNNGNAKWTLTVPDDMDIKFSSGSGDFEAKNLSAELKLNVGSGDFLFEGMSGEIVSNSGSGDMRLIDFSGELKSNTGSGDVDAKGIKGEMKINTGSGDIDISDASGAISANVGSGSISARGITVAHKSGFNAGSGDVEVILNVSPKADISVNSGSGDAQLDFNGNEIEGMITMKASKNKGEIRAPFEFDTTEEINNHGSQTMIKKTVKKGDSSIQIKIGSGSGTASLTK